MKANVTAFPGVSLAHVTGKPEQTVVDMLKEALAQAKRGELSAIALVKVCRNGAIDVGWEAPGSQGHNIVAGATYLMHNLIAAAALRETANVQGED